MHDAEIAAAERPVERLEEPASGEGADDPHAEAVAVALDAFYRDVIEALGEHMLRKSATTQGAPAVVKNVARIHGVRAAHDVMLPRLSRAEFQELGTSTRKVGTPYRRFKLENPT